MSHATFAYFLLILAATSVLSAFEVCPKCSSKEVPYPLSTSEKCGDPRYRIHCNNGNLEFKSANGFYYQILSINPTASSLTISPPQIQKDTCYSSDISFGGLQLDDSLPFNISTHNTVMLLNCSESILLSPLNCSSSSICRQFEEQELEASGCKGTLCCHYLKDSSMTSYRIRARIGGCTAYTSVVNMNIGDPLDVWNYGIELQWLPLNTIRSYKNYPICQLFSMSVLKICISNYCCVIMQMQWKARQNYHSRTMRTWKSLQLIPLLKFIKIINGSFDSTVWVGEKLASTALVILYQFIQHSCLLMVYLNVTYYDLELLGEQTR